MTDSSTTGKTGSPSTSTERMRKLRDRQKRGIVLCKLEARGEWVDMLQRLGLLSEGEVADHARVAEKLVEIIDLALRRAIRERVSR